MTPYNVEEEVKKALRPFVGAVVMSDEKMIQTVEQLVLRAREDMREQAASVVECLELLVPSGISSTEQLRIYDALSKAADAIRALPLDATKEDPT